MKLKLTAFVPALIAGVLLSSSAVHAQAPSPKMTEEAPGLLKKAKITPEKATATAMAKVPGGVLQTANIEEEDGKLIFSFDIKVKGKSGIEEVAVDAMTGSVLSVEHETPANEAKEAAREKAEKAKAKADSAKAKVKKGTEGSN